MKKGLGLASPAKCMKHPKLHRDREGERMYGMGLGFWFYWCWGEGLEFHKLTLYLVNLKHKSGNLKHGKWKKKQVALMVSY